MDDWISLGTNCEISYQLRMNLGNNRPTLPFDWWITPLSSIPDLLDNNFEIEISSKTLHLASDRNTVIHEPTGILFHHDFVRDDAGFIVSDWSDQIHQVREKTIRRIDRLNEYLKIPQICVLNKRGLSPDYHSSDIHAQSMRDEMYDLIRGALGRNHRLIIFNSGVPGLGHEVLDYGDPVCHGHFGGSTRGWSEAFERAKEETLSVG